jgi:hypothetical protein
LSLPHDVYLVDMSVKLVSLFAPNPGTSNACICLGGATWLARKAHVSPRGFEHTLSMNVGDLSFATTLDMSTGCLSLLKEIIDWI